MIDLLDPNGKIPYRLFREHCILSAEGYIKDISFLGRDLDKVIIVDNSAVSYRFQPENAIPIKSWFDDMEDKELYTLIPFLKQLSSCKNVKELLSKQAPATKETNQDDENPPKAIMIPSFNTSPDLDEEPLEINLCEKGNNAKEDKDTNEKPQNDITFFKHSSFNKYRSTFKQQCTSQKRIKSTFCPNKQSNSRLYNLSCSVLASSPTTSIHSHKSSQVFITPERIPSVQNINTEEKKADKDTNIVPAPEKPILKSCKNLTANYDKRSHIRQNSATLQISKRPTDLHPAKHVYIKLCA